MSEGIQPVTAHQCAEQDHYREEVTALRSLCRRLEASAEEGWSARDAEVQAKLRVCAAIRAEYDATIATLRAALAEACDLYAEHTRLGWNYDSQVKEHESGDDRIATLRQLAEVKT